MIKWKLNCMGKTKEKHQTLYKEIVSIWSIQCLWSIQSLFTQCPSFAIAFHLGNNEGDGVLKWDESTHKWINSSQNLFANNKKWKQLPRSSAFESAVERSFDCLDRAAGMGSCIDASVGIVRPRCTTKPVCKRIVSVN